MQTAASSPRGNVITMQPVPRRVRLAVGDFSGTFVDKWSRHVLVAFETACVREGLHVPASAFMHGLGLPKADHLRTAIARYTCLPVESWPFSTHRKVDRALARALELLRTEQVTDWAQPLPGVREFFEWARPRIAVGVTTGFDSALALRVADVLRTADCAPTWIACPPHFCRPSASGILAIAAQAEVHRPSEIIKFGDNKADADEARAAGVYSIGILRYSPALFARLTPNEQRIALLRTSGPFYATYTPSRSTIEAARAEMATQFDAVVDSMHDLPRAIEARNAQLTPRIPACLVQGP